MSLRLFLKTKFKEVKDKIVGMVGAKLDEKQPKTREVAGVEGMGGFGTSSNPLRMSHSPKSRGRKLRAGGP